MTFVGHVTRADGVGGPWGPPPFLLEPAHLLLNRRIGGIGLGITPNRFCIGQIQGAGPARARIRRREATGNMY